VQVHRSKGIVAVLVTAAALVAGCGSSSNDNNGGADGSSGGDAAALKPSDMNPVARDQLKQGGVLNWGIDEYPAQLNYNQIDGTSEPSSHIIYALMPRPFRVDPAGKVTANTNYVTSAAVTSTSPTQVVTYKLNKDARWSDGKPITWRDYEAEWKALRDPGGKFKIASATGYERISSISRGADDYEFTATFAKPFGEWQALFDPLYPAATNSDPKRFDTDYKTGFPVTGGAFRVKKVDQSGKTITVERDPKWWGEKPVLDTIVFRSLSDDAIPGAFANGEIDYALAQNDAATYRRITGVAGGEAREAGGPDFRHFTLNGTGAILKDLKVRQAVAMAINRDVIAKADLTGLNWPTRTMGNHFLVNTQDGYKDNSGAVGKFDPAKARTLLDQAGWTLSGNVRKKGGKTLTLRFVIPSGVTTSRQESELVQKMFQDVGIKLNVQTVPSDDFFEKYVIPGNYDITPFAWIGTPFPISSATSIYGNPTKDSKGELQVQQNYARTGSKQIDDLMTKAEESTDRTTAIGFINQADTQLWNAVHSIIMYQRPQITAAKSTLANLGSKGLAYDVYEDIGFTK
jgi:peptide/nickel transport system substrate-binding protein